MNISFGFGFNANFTPYGLQKKSLEFRMFLEKFRSEFDSHICIQYIYHACVHCVREYTHQIYTVNTVTFINRKS